MLIVARGGKSVRIEKQTFQDEDALQRFIQQNPEVIPLDDLGEDSPLHVLGREFPTANGPIDVLATDLSGNTYIIETKLFKNPDKRQVLAQVLDYGAALWAAEPSVEDLLEGLRRDANHRQAPDPLVRLTEFLDGDAEAVSSHLERLVQALAEGRFTAIVLMDRLDDRLRSLIHFVHENSRFQLLAVELDYYRHEGTEIVAPRLYGTETKRRKGRVSGHALVWSESIFFERLAERTTPDTVAAVRKLFEFAAPLGKVNWGGTSNPTMAPRFVRGYHKAPIVVLSSGRIICKLGGLSEAPGGPEFVARAAERLQAAGLDLSTDRLRGRWAPEAWVPRVDSLVAAFREALAEN
ncbi:MAG: hypothetical protein ACKVZ0_23225 [Gemmatimonadales bacterium]